MCKCNKNRKSAQIAYAVWESTAPAEGEMTQITLAANIFLKTVGYGNHKLHSGSTFNLPAMIAQDLFAHHAPIVIG